MFLRVRLYTKLLSLLTPDADANLIKEDVLVKTKEIVLSCGAA